jgi:hypothetical protein
MATPPSFDRWCSVSNPSLCNKGFAVHTRVRVDNAFSSVACDGRALLIARNALVARTTCFHRDDVSDASWEWDHCALPKISVQASNHLYLRHIHPCRVLPAIESIHLVH